MSISSISSLAQNYPSVMTPSTVSTTGGFQQALNASGSTASSAAQTSAAQTAQTSATQTASQTSAAKPQHGGHHHHHGGGGSASSSQASTLLSTLSSLASPSIDISV